MDSDEELELLLAFQSVPQTPPHSPPAPPPLSENKPRSAPQGPATTSDLRETFQEVFGYDSGDEEELNKNASMDVFRDVVKSSYSKVVESHSFSTKKHLSANRSGNHIDVEVYSGLRIRDRVVSGASSSNLLSDLRFLPLQGIRTAAMGEKISGSWATIGVLAEKGMPKVCSTGKNFAIWKIASLDTTTVSLFLFGDAYAQHYKESAGSIITVLNAKVRRDAKRNELNLSIFMGNQLVKLGTSVDYCICKGSRKDGSPCSIVVNRRHGEYCNYHASAMQQKYKTKRAELKGGNLASGFCMIQKQKQSQDILDATHDMNLEKPAKHVSLKGLKTILSNAEKVTTKYHSQGIRCLARFADTNNENMNPNSALKRKSRNESVSLLKRSKLNKEADSIASKLSEDKGRTNDKCGLIELDFEELDDNTMAQAMAFCGKGLVALRENTSSRS